VCLNTLQSPGDPMFMFESWQNSSSTSHCHPCGSVSFGNWQKIHSEAIRDITSYCRWFPELLLVEIHYLNFIMPERPFRSFGRSDVISSRQQVDPEHSRILTHQQLFTFGTLCVRCLKPVIWTGNNSFSKVLEPLCSNQLIARRIMAK
jgi:hypothetical protein